MLEKEKKPVKIVETILRDAHQSLIATRMSTEVMLPILSKLDEVGFYALECWGGATFDACLRFLNEDPWERLRKIRKGCPNTKLQMLFRGQNILGYRPYADDVVEYFVQKSVDNGIDIIRIFDCLNDLRNLETSVKAAIKEKCHVQIALSYTTGDAYTPEYWMQTAKAIEELGADSICIKDMAGLLVPYKAAELVKAIRKVAKGGEFISAEIQQQFAANPPIPELTPRQKEILASMVRGLSDRDISRQLGIRLDGVNDHVRAILAKIGAANRTEAVGIAMHKHLIKT